MRWPLLLCGLSQSLLALSSAAAQDAVADLARQCQDYAKQIAHCRYAYETEKMDTEGKLNPKSHDTLTFVHDSPRLLMRRETPWGVKGRPAIEFAYDGATFQALPIPTVFCTGQLAEKFKYRYDRENPLLLPIEFAFRNTDFLWHELEESGPWEYFQEHTRQAGALEGRQAFRFTGEQESPGSSFLIEVAPGASVPMKWTLTAKGYRSEGTILSWKKIDETLSVPQEAECKVYADGRLLWAAHYTLAYFQKLNPAEIRDTIFAISHPFATEVINLDEKPLSSPEKQSDKSTK